MTLSPDDARLLRARVASPPSRSAGGRARPGLRLALQRGVGAECGARPFAWRLGFAMLQRILPPLPDSEPLPDDPPD